MLSREAGASELGFTWPYVLPKSQMQCNLPLNIFLMVEINRSFVNPSSNMKSVMMKRFNSSFGCSSSKSSMKLFSANLIFQINSWFTAFFVLWIKACSCCDTSVAQPIIIWSSFPFGQITSNALLFG